MGSPELVRLGKKSEVRPLQKFWSLCCDRHCICQNSTHKTHKTPIKLLGAALLVHKAQDDILTPQNNTLTIVNQLLGGLKCHLVFCEPSACFADLQLGDLLLCICSIFFISFIRCVVSGWSFFCLFVAIICAQWGASFLSIWSHSCCCFELFMPIWSHFVCPSTVILFQQVNRRRAGCGRQEQVDEEMQKLKKLADDVWQCNGFWIALSKRFHLWKWAS